MRDPLSDIFNEELKMFTHTRVAVKGEIEGCWQSPKLKSRCRQCGSILIKVPYTGHKNSPFWINERADGQILKACPKNCLESDALYCMNFYLEKRVFMKDGSESYDWEWNYKKFEKGWIMPNGQFIFCGPMEHISSASEFLPENKYKPESAGFVKFSCGSFYWGAIPPNQTQKNILFDIFTQCGHKITEKDIKEMENEVGEISIVRN